MTAQKHLRLVSSDTSRQQPEIANIEINRFVTPSQAEAIEALLVTHEAAELLPTVLDVLKASLDKALDSGQRTDFYRVAGMAEGLLLLIGQDHRLVRVRDRAEALAREIGRN